MHFLSLVCFLAFLGSASACCVPASFEGILAEVIAESQHTAPEIVHGTAHFSYDHTKMMIVNKGMFEVNNTFEHILTMHNYQKHETLTVVNSHCFRTHLHEDMPHCVPHNASVHHFHFGVHGDMLHAQGFLVDMHTHKEYLVTTRSECVPILQVEFGIIEGNPTMEVSGYGNITHGIHDPTIFDEPHECHGVPFTHDEVPSPIKKWSFL